MEEKKQKPLYQILRELEIGAEEPLMLPIERMLSVRSSCGAIGKMTHTRFVTWTDRDHIYVTRRPLEDAEKQRKQL